MSPEQVHRLERALNDFTRRQHLGLSPLVEDGIEGPALDHRLVVAKHFLGIRQDSCDTTTGAWLLARLLRPNRVDSSVGATQTVTRRGRSRRIRQRGHIVRLQALARVRPGVGRFDGKPVAKGFIPYLTWAREDGWPGQLASGWRDPLYSEHLCMVKCGRPSCPGTCAGRASRHSQTELDEGAIDVTAYDDFGRRMAACPLEPKLTNHLPNDRLHFSVPGN